MSHIRVLICRVDDPASDQFTELSAFDLPSTDTSTLQPETTLDELEMIAQATGNAILRRTLQAQSDIIDTELTEQHRQAFPPQMVHADGHEPVTLASRFTQRVPALTLSRQICSHPATQTHVMPGNAALPAHNGIIITRGLPLLDLFAPAGVALCLGRPLARRPRPTMRTCSRTPPSAASCAAMASSWGRRSRPRSPR